MTVKKLDFDIDEQGRMLWRNRAIATALLAVMALVALATNLMREPGFWIMLIRAGAEASLVGGLADWFAVTALFRRPLGLPIPHTAVVPANKDRIGRGLAAFLERNFLTRELLAGRVMSLDPALRLAQFLALPNNAQALANRLVQPLPYLLHAVDDKDIRHFVTAALGEQLHRLEVAPLLGQLVRVLINNGLHGELLDRGLDLCMDFLKRNEERLEDLAAERRQFWLRKAFDRQVVRTITHSLMEVIEDLRKPNGETRINLLKKIEERVQAMINSPEERARMEAAKTELLHHPDVQLWLNSVWDLLRANALEDFASTSSHTRAGLAAAINSIGRTLSADAGMRDRLNATIDATLAEFLPWRKELVNFVVEVVQSWDARQFAARLELAVGSDLQYVRINGTIVGALVGCALYLIKTLLL